MFDPINDNCGFYSPPHQNDNNCYAYATDVATNTFPQPGRGSGDKWHDNTCEEMRAASERDGLVWFGNDLPSVDEKPEIGHFVALYIWHGTNFHWARRDSNGAVLLLAPRCVLISLCTGLWSHKPGGSPVQDHECVTDRRRHPMSYTLTRSCSNNNTPIIDASKADLSPWSEFCGYFTVTPSAVCNAQRCID